MSGKSKSEPVDGARIAAEILKRMPQKDQQRLVSSISDKAPELAANIKKNLHTFEEIAELTPKSIQVLLKEIDHKDLVVSLKTAAEGVKAALFANMSEGRRKLVESDFAALPPMRASLVDEAQQRILTKMDELKTAGLIHAVGKRDTYA